MLFVNSSTGVCMLPAVQQSLAAAELLAAALDLVDRAATCVAGRITLASLSVLACLLDLHQAIHRSATPQLDAGAKQRVPYIHHLDFEYIAPTATLRIGHPFRDSLLYSHTLPCCCIGLAI